MTEFDSKDKLYRQRDLSALHELQMIYCGFIDIQIETRKDLRLTAVSFCNYSFNFGTKSKLFIYKLNWSEDNTNTISKIRKELEKLSKQY